MPLNSGYGAEAASSGWATRLAEFHGQAECSAGHCRAERNSIASGSGGHLLQNEMWTGFSAVDLFGLRNAGVLSIGSVLAFAPSVNLGLRRQASNDQGQSDERQRHHNH